MFAAAALTGLLADQSLSELADTTLATRAYELASAMTEERDRISGCLQPALTAAERDAIAWAALHFGNKAEELGRRNNLWVQLTGAESILRNLLARLS
jgi:hypothetical protein